MGALVRAYPWEQTALGPISSWPQSLLTSVSICLKSRFPMLIWWGADLTMIYNDAYIPIPGSKHPHCLGRKGREVWPEVWDIIGPMLQGVMQRGEATWSEEIMLPLDRKGFPEECYFTFSYSPIHDESGGIGGIFTAVSEVTGKVIGERRLHVLRELGERTVDARSVEEAAALAARVLDHSPADVPFARLYLLDADRKTARLQGSAGKGPESPSLPEVIDLTQASPEDPWHLARVLQSGREELIEGVDSGRGPLSRGLVLPIGQDGMKGVLLAGVSPRSELDANYQGFFMLLASTVSTAIAKAHAYEEARKRADALAELDRAKTTFFSNVSHELRTPLTLMLGPLEELRARAAGLGLPPPDQEQLALAHRNARRLLRLVNSLLDFSRIEAGRMKAQFRPTALAPFTASLASVFGSTFEAAGLTLTLDTPELGVPVYVDPEMWEKIVFNLLSNAFKFTLRGGITVRLTRHEDKVRLTVQDTGTGIPEAELPRLFERFHRVEGAESRTHEGTGIGLALTQELVKLHGGTIEVRSQWGVGSEFQVELPLGRAHLPAEQVAEGDPAPAPGPGRLGRAFLEEATRWLPEGSARADAAHPENRARILLADDNADMRAYVQHLLGETWEVEAVADGEAALQQALAHPPDLILTDVMMPRLDGFGLIKALRAEAATRTLPIILLSARAGEEARIEGLDAGADDYLVKPFSARELVARVSANLAISRLRQETQEQLADLLTREQNAHGREIEVRQKLERLAEDLQRAIDARDEFLSIASHELKTPITSLKLQLQQLRRRLDPNTPQALEPGKLGKLLDSSSRQLDRLTRLIEDLLDVARIRAGKLSFSFEEFFADELFSEVLERFSDQLAEADCRTEVDVQPRLSVVWDRTRMEQVLVNLVANAIKYAPGVLIQIRLHAEGDQARLVVRDFGPGIPQERQAKIFERFERATSARNISGLGLGLFIASEIITAHQGTIRVESEAGKGAAFIIQLPLRLAAEPSL
jgi:signal transduction histidine kinase